MILCGRFFFNFPQRDDGIEMDIVGFYGVEKSLTMQQMLETFLICFMRNSDSCCIVNDKLYFWC